MRVLRNNVFVDRVFFDDATGAADEATIENNWQSAANSVHDASIAFNSSRQVARGNKLDDGNADTVTVGVNGDYALIEGNDLRFGNVVRTASSGGNRVWNNARHGTLTLHATDSAGGNTP